MSGDLWCIATWCRPRARMNIFWSINISVFSLSRSLPNRTVFRSFAEEISAAEVWTRWFSSALPCLHLRESAAPRLQYDIQHTLHTNTIMIFSILAAKKWSRPVLEAGLVALTTIYDMWRLRVFYKYKYKWRVNISLRKMALGACVNNTENISVTQILQYRYGNTFIYLQFY